MALPIVGDEFYPTPDEIRNQILTDIRYSFSRHGLDVNVKAGSDHFIRADAYAKRLSVAIQNNQLSRQDLSPLTATGDALVTLAGIYGVTKRAASPSAGAVVVTCTGGVTIPADFVCAAPNGTTYKTRTANTVVTGDSVDVIAIETGTATNQDSGTILNWTDASIGALQQTCVVDVGGIDGGADEDDEEKLRSRLIRKLSFPAVGGNFAHVIELAEESTASVEFAFVYSAVRGPSSYDVAVTKAGGDRALDSAIVGDVEAHILAEMPGNADLNVTTVTQEQVDVVIDTTLPLPIAAGGAGGGWIDAVPWPSSADAVLAKVTGVLANTFTVNSTSADPPVAGKHFSIWDYAAQAMRQFTIQAVSGPSGSYGVTINTSLSDAYAFVATGMYVSAGAESISDYADLYVEQLLALGPGEKTDSADILPRGRRRLGVDEENPSDITNLLFGPIKDAHPEVGNLEYAARYATGTTNTLTTPSIPATTADPPKILTVKHLAFRKL